MYLNEPEVQAALGVDREWKDCKTLPEAGLIYGGDWMKEFQGKVAALLEGGVPVLIYAGEYDYMCNWLGNLVRSLKHTRTKEENSAPYLKPQSHIRQTT